MTSLEQSLAAVLQAEVDKRVSIVQAAADAWVQAFKEQAERMIRDPATQYAFMPTPVPTYVPIPRAVIEAENEQMPAHMRLPAGAEDETPRGVTFTDSAAVSSNMSVR